MWEVWVKGSDPTVVFEVREGVDSFEMKPVGAPVEAAWRIDKETFLSMYERKG